MPTVNFYLKKADGQPPRSLIFLQCKYSSNRLVYSFGQKVNPGKWNGKMKGAKKVFVGGNWDYDKQRVKSNKETTADGKYSLNDLLDKLERALNKGYNTEIANGVPAMATLRHYLDAVVYQNAEETNKPTIFNLFDRFISGEIKNKGKEKSKNTLKTYSTTKDHLANFAAAAKYKVTFDSINLDFFYKYTSYLKGLGLMQNSIGKNITIIKTVMGEAVDLGYTENMQFRHKKFTIADEESDSVYLTEKEVLAIYKHDFSKNIKLDQVRDLFVVGCFTGLRYSDYSNIRPDNIVTTDGELFIKMITQKTKELVIIPCNPVVLNIFKKYEKNENRLPKSISSQKFNDYVKDVCEAAGLKEKGRLSSEPSKMLYECISSHTARRSFATNLYLEGFPSQELMKITGHRSEASFRKYIKVTKLESAKRLSEHIKKNWSSKILKIA